MIGWLFIFLALGVIIGYFMCMFKVIKLKEELVKIRIDVLHEQNKDALLRKLRKEQASE